VSSLPAGDGALVERERETMKTTTYYYHAGCGTEGNITRWSTHTRRTRSAAVMEARRLARRHGGRGIVEFWDRARGLRPSDQDAVIGAFWTEKRLTEEE
jgi:hypothetical protein